MEIAELHGWDLSTAEARDLQTALAARVDTSRRLQTWRTVAAADLSYNKFDLVLHAAVVVIDATTHEEVESVAVSDKARFPYVPGLLSFRELPAVLECFRALRTVPDVVLCDGQGYAHPRRMGLACHLGLWLGLPTVGCAKSRLIGEHAEPGPERGDRVPLIDQGETIGTVLRTRPRVRPLYVSAGHLCDLDSAVAVVLSNTGRYRLPAAARAAHLRVNELRQQFGPRPRPREAD